MENLAEGEKYAVPPLFARPSRRRAFAGTGGRCDRSDTQTL